MIADWVGWVQKGQNLDYILLKWCLTRSFVIHTVDFRNIGISRYIGSKIMTFILRISTCNNGLFIRVIHKWHRPNFPFFYSLPTPCQPNYALKISLHHHFWYLPLGWRHYQWTLIVDLFCWRINLLLQEPIVSSVKL